MKSGFTGKWASTIFAVVRYVLFRTIASITLAASSCFVGRGFEDLVQFLDLDQLNGIRLLLEQVSNGFAAYVVSNILQSVTSSQCFRTWTFLSSNETPNANSSVCDTIRPGNSAETAGGW